MPPTNPEQVLTLAQVVGLTSLSRATLWRRISDRTFPAPIRLSANRVGWLQSNVRAWLVEREHG